jgi:hypothetical protein
LHFIPAGIGERSGRSKPHALKISGFPAACFFMFVQCHIYLIIIINLYCLLKVFLRMQRRAGSRKFSGCGAPTAVRFAIRAKKTARM